MTVEINDPARKIYEAFNLIALGKDNNAVLDAALNIMVNVMRQQEASRSLAEARWNLLFARGKTLLLEKHYDSVTGKRRNVLPSTQVVQMPFFGGERG